MSLKPKVLSLKSAAAATTKRLQTPNSRLQTSDLPFVLVNMAMTADGKIATANRAVSSFGSARDHEHLLALRATADAVMAGARTVDLNEINLGPGPKHFRRARLRRGLTEFNLRVIVSGSGSINPKARIFSWERRRPAGEFPSDAALDLPAGRQRSRSTAPIIILTTERASTSARQRLRALADDVKVFGRTDINFRRALRWLHAEWGVNRLLCEGGGELNGALFRAGLVSELHLTVCPKIFGGRAAPTIADGLGFAKLADAARLELQSTTRVGDELFLVFARPSATGR